jgi:hypothetical protein
VLELLPRRRAVGVPALRHRQPRHGHDHGLQGVRELEMGSLREGLVRRRPGRVRGPGVRGPGPNAGDPHRSGCGDEVVSGLRRGAATFPSPGCDPLARHPYFHVKAGGRARWMGRGHGSSAGMLARRALEGMIPWEVGSWVYPMPRSTGFSTETGASLPGTKQAPKNAVGNGLHTPAGSRDAMGLKRSGRTVEAGRGLPRHLCT